MSKWEGLNENATAYNAHVLTDTHICFCDGCQTKRAQASSGMLSRPTVPDLPSAELRRGAGCRAAAEEGPCAHGLSLDTELTGSFQIGNTCTIRPGRNQKSTTYKNISFHRHFSLHDLAPPPSLPHFFIGNRLSGEGQALMPHKLNEWRLYIWFVSLFLSHSECTWSCNSQGRDFPWHMKPAVRNVWGGLLFLLISVFVLFFPLMPCQHL